MQVIYKNKNEGCISKKTGTVCIIIYTERISKCIEEKHYGESRKQEFKLYNSRRIFIRFERRIWQRRNEMIKVVKLKKIEQEIKIIEKFVQEFRKITRGSGYEEKLLVKEFKKGMNRVIRRKLMETE